MRQKKFGVWDKVNKCWLTGAEALEIYWVDDELQLHIGIKYANLPFFNETAEKFEIVEYTGLKDCKRTKEYPEGQEIYEGDIVRYFSYEARDGKQIRPERFYAVEFDIDNLFKTKNIIQGNGTLEIIGNIYENKNLIK